jgi:hypothetical protein
MDDFALGPIRLNLSARISQSFSGVFLSQQISISIIRFYCQPNRALATSFFLSPDKSLSSTAAPPTAYTALPVESPYPASPPVNLSALLNTIASAHRAPSCLHPACMSLPRYSAAVACQRCCRRVLHVQHRCMCRRR